MNFDDMTLSSLRPHPHHLKLAGNPRLLKRLSVVKARSGPDGPIHWNSEAV